MNRDSKYVSKVMSYLLAMKNSERFWDSDITVFSCNLEINGLIQSMSGHTEYLKSVKRISDSPTTLGSAYLQHIVLFVCNLLYLFITIIYVKSFLCLLPSQDTTLIVLINIYIIYAYLSSCNAKQRVNTFVFLEYQKMSLSRQTRYDTIVRNEKSPKLFFSNNTRNRALVQSTLKRFANTRNSGWRRSSDSSSSSTRGGLEITFIAT